MIPPPPPSGFIHRLRARSAAAGRRIGFPEAGEARTARAIARLRTEGWVRPVEIGPDAGGLAGAAERLAAGELDGVVAGATHATADVIRAGLRIVGLAEGVETVSAAFHLVLADAGDRVLTLTDAAVVPTPTPRQMAESAAAACDARRAIVGDEPVVAFLSYSTRGSAAGSRVDRVREAFEHFRRRRPGVVADGELQADAALVPAVASEKAPASPVAGRANLLVFPSLEAANIAYKLIERLAGARALGPILQGLRRPLNDLSRGASVSDIVDVACITALMSRGNNG